MIREGRDGREGKNDQEVFVYGPVLHAILFFISSQKNYKHHVTLKNFKKLKMARDVA